MEVVSVQCCVASSSAIVTAYETNTQHDPNNNNAMLGVHASASAIIQYGKIARKQVHYSLVYHIALCFLTILFIFAHDSFSFMHAKWVLLLVFGKRGSGHPDSDPHHSHRAYRGLLPEDQTAGQMLLTAGWCHGQKRVYAGKSVSHCLQSQSSPART